MIKQCMELWRVGSEMIIADKERKGILTIKVAKGERIPQRFDDF